MAKKPPFMGKENKKEEKAEAKSGKGGGKFGNKQAPPFSKGGKTSSSGKKCK